MNHHLLLTNQPTNQSISKMVSTTRFNKNQKSKQIKQSDTKICVIWIFRNLCINL